jgi:hypothetical protein
MEGDFEMVTEGVNFEFKLGEAMRIFEVTCGVLLKEAVVEGAPRRPADFFTPLNCSRVCFEKGLLSKRKIKM